MKFKQLLSAFLLLAAIPLAGAVHAGATDIEYSPTTSAGHDFNHAPIGQSFTALAAQVKAGIYLADDTSFTNWLSTVYGSMPPYPYAVAPSLTINIKLLAGEGPAGSVIDSRDVTLAAPFMGFVDVDYSVDRKDNNGNILNPKIDLIPGNKYTLLLTDISNQAYPNGVVGWVVPGVHDYSTGAALPPGAYADGLPILQGALVADDAGIGDNAFHVIDMNPNGGTTTQACSGANAVITSVGRDFIVVNGGQNLADHVWYAPQAATIFTGGTTTFVAGELVTYTGTLDPIAGCYATTMTVMPAPTPIVISGTLPNGQAGAPYSATLIASGGVAPYQWTANGLPAGVNFNAGVFSGTPTTAGSYAVTVDLNDSLGSVTQTTYNVTIAAATSTSCTKPKGAKEAAGKGTVSAVGGDYLVVGGKKVYYASCTKISFGGYSSAFAVGQSVEWEGYSLSGKISAKVLSVN